MVFNFICLGISLTLKGENLDNLVLGQLGQNEESHRICVTIFLIESSPDYLPGAIFRYRVIARSYFDNMVMMYGGCPCIQCYKSTLLSLQSHRKSSRHQGSSSPRSNRETDPRAIPVIRNHGLRCETHEIG